jgi:hypothetical protein
LRRGVEVDWVSDDGKRRERRDRLNARARDGKVDFIAAGHGVGVNDCLAEGAGAGVGSRGDGEGAEEEAGFEGLNAPV